MESSSNPVLQPFAGERFASADITPLIAPPYDVISPEARAALAGRNPHNIVHLILPDGNGDKYENAARLYRQWRKDGVLVRDPAPSVYVIAQRVRLPDGRTVTRTGMLAGVAAEPYDARRVRPHEKTHAGPKQDRLSLIRALKATFESIFLIAPDKKGSLRDGLKRVTASKPTATGSIDGVDVQLWRVAGADATSLTSVVEGAPLYIADGHHRYETTRSYRDENPAAQRTVALVVPATDSGLTVLATHRIIRGATITAAAVRDALAPWFEVADLGGEKHADALMRLGKKGTACIVVLPDGAVTAAFRPDAAKRLEKEIPEATVRALDVARVDHLVVGPLRKGSAGEPGIEYSADLDTAVASMRQGAAAAVLLNPTTVEQVFAVADAQGVMPQKSTYFVPKVPSGLAGLSYE